MQHRIFTNSSGTFETIAQTCPACNANLFRKLGPAGSVFIYCANGPCHSLACNEGATARDIETALVILTTNFERELDRVPALLVPTAPNWENTVEAFLCR